MPCTAALSNMCVCCCVCACVRHLRMANAAVRENSMRRAFSSLGALDDEIAQTCESLKQLKVEKLRLITKQLETEFVVGNAPTPMAVGRQPPPFRLYAYP